jgi:CheY-like chemotaxis protein/KaiC/GvpD/RAD55 family RecA-like ATPase
MQPIASNKIPSGIEPVDKLLGGLEVRQMYLVHGDASGKSLFGVQFLIEGLKRGQSCALITSSSPEDAVRRFARLGYDCLEDIYSSRLIILECAEDMIERAARLRELSPVLRELEWLMGETHPDRVVFDPITNLIVGGQGGAQARAREFAAWAADFGSTIVLISNGADSEVSQSLLPLVKESLRFYVKEAGEQAIRFLAFEKSPDIADQAIEVDPSRGIFLLEQSSRQGSSVIDLGVLETGAKEQPRAARESARSEETNRAPVKPLDSNKTPLKPQPQATERRDLLAELLSDLSELVEDTSPLELDLPEVTQPAEPQVEAPKPAPKAAQEAVVVNTAEELLRPPEFIKETPQQITIVAGVQPKDCRVLIIDGNPSSCEKLARALNEYKVETAGDAVTGLAKLISFKPDLVILDIDLPVIDGFRLLTHIRSSLSVPIIVVSSSHLRASDRIQSVELGADYYITKPFNVREIKQKARQLIARYRGINEWITLSTGSAPSPKGHDLSPGCGRSAAAEPNGNQYVPYQDFFARVEEKVKEATESGASFSIVGCRLPGMTERGDDLLARLVNILLSMVRDSDLISMNQHRDLVVLLADADASGARAFISRLRDRVMQEVNQKLYTWLRTFPTLEETTEATQMS